MTKYLIPFPSAAMVVPDEDLPAVSDAAHAVVQEAKDAGVWVFGGGINESIPPVLVDGDGTVPPRRRLAWPMWRAYSSIMLSRM